VNLQKFPKKRPDKKELSVDDYKQLYNHPNALPKKKYKNLVSGNGDTPIKSKVKKVIVPEAVLQKTCNEMITAYGYQYLRFEDSFLSWVSMNAPVHIRKQFFNQIGGRFADSLILEPLGNGFFLAAKLELKTEDINGHAVGALHGKQKKVANEEGWMIARNPKQIQNALETFKNTVKVIKELLKGKTP